MWTILMLTLSNVFMTFAWYGHLKFKSSPLWIAILASWGIAIGYMDGNSVAYPVGSKPQAEQEAERLRVVVERAQPVGRSICRGSDWEARNKSWQICVFFD